MTHNSKNSKRMKRGNKTDELGRLDHTRSSDVRAKTKRNWKHEYMTEEDDFRREYEEEIMPLLLGTN